MFRSFSSFGFSGSRVSGSVPASLASVVVAAVAPFGSVSCGCARGVDAVVRPLASSVFRVSSFGVGRGAFARRSVAFVRALASSPRPLLFCFPLGSCPAPLVPSPSSSRCFGGFGSGSWASAAFAVGLGVPVVVFGVAYADLPSSWCSLWAVWRPVVVGGVSGFVLGE